MNTQSSQVLVCSATYNRKDYIFHIIPETRMCILFFHIDADPGSNGYKLILASNRDEYYARPTAKAHAWEDTPWIFGGYDMQPGKEGGTWLGLSAKDGVLKFGALLNLTGEEHSADFLGEFIDLFYSFSLGYMYELGKLPTITCICTVNSFRNRFEASWNKHYVNSVQKLDGYKAGLSFTAFHMNQFSSKQ